MQVIYGEKTERRIYRHRFLKFFSLSDNPKYFSNTSKSVKLIDVILVTHIQSQRKKLLLQNDHPVLLINAVFLSQMVPPVLHKLGINFISLICVLPNTTNLFRSSNLRVNDAARAFMKGSFVCNRANGRISKRMFQKKQSTPNFPKNEYFLLPDTHTYVCVSGDKKCSCFGKFGVLCFLETIVLRFALSPYYRRFH